MAENNTGLCGDNGGEFHVDSYTLEITENGEYDVLPYGTVNVNVGGGGSSYELVAEQEYTVSTTSSSAVTVADIDLGEYAHQTKKILYVRIRDRAGKRNGYFYGSDNWIIDVPKANGSSTLVSTFPRALYGITSNGLIYGSGIAGMFPAANSSCYGVYANGVTGAGKLQIRARYSSTFGTVDGTYLVQIYLLEWPDNISPLE